MPRGCNIVRLNMHPTGDCDCSLWNRRFWLSSRVIIFHDAEWAEGLMDAFAECAYAGTQRHIRADPALQFSENR